MEWTNCLLQTNRSPSRTSGKRHFQAGSHRANGDRIPLRVLTRSSTYQRFEGPYNTRDLDNPSGFGVSTLGYVASAVSSCEGRSDQGGESCACCHFCINSVWDEATVKHVDFISWPSDTQSVCEGLGWFNRHHSPSPWASLF